MSKVKRIIKNIEVDLSDYYDSKTGELLVSMIDKNTAIVVQQDTGMKEITSSDYSVIDSESFLVLMKLVNNSELAKIMKMGICTKTPLNIVYNNTLPHTNKTLQKYLEMSSESMFLKLTKKLIKVGVLYQLKGLIHGEVRVTYMLNPFLFRKRRLFESKVFEVFNQFKLEK